MTESMEGLRGEIDEVERRALRHVNPGIRAVAIAVGVMAVLVSLLLPWVSGVQGWRLLTGDVPVGVRVSAVASLFAWTAVTVAVGLSVVSLMTRRWSAAMVSALLCSLAAVLGGLAVWSTQTGPGRDPGPGPGFGLVLAALAVTVIAAQWLRTAFSRSP